MQILVVEDDAILAHLASATLESCGHNVIGPAYSAEEARSLVLKNRTDLALVDINLAGNDEGIQLVHELRHTYGIYSIFVSGQIAAARANQREAIGFLPKPYRLDDLARSVDYAEAIVTQRAPPFPTAPAALELFMSKN